MSSTLKRTQRRALTFTRSFANAVKSKFFTTLSPDKHCSPFDRYSAIPKHDISGPRQLRRRPLPVFRQLHFIHRLPVEILAYVLVLGSEDDMMFPVTVSHVCRTWRQIAFRTPSLWRRITLTSQTDMWRERIHRARACTLDIQLLDQIPTRSGFVRQQQLDTYIVNWYMYLVIPLIRRWRSLEVNFITPSPYLWNAALSGCCSNSRRAQALALEDLSLVYRSNDDSKEFCLFSGIAPRLRRVTLDGIRLTWLPSLFGNLSYLDYTHHSFTTGYQAVQDVISILEVSSRLVELKLLFPRKPNPYYPSRQHPVTRHVLLPSLINLHLRVEGPAIPFELAHLMSLIVTPSLALLRLLDLDQRPLSFPNLKSFFYVYPLPPSLQILCIEHGWYDSRMMTPAIRALPNIRQLVVRRRRLPDQVLNLHSRSRKGTYWTRDVYGQMHFHVHPEWKAGRGHDRNPW